MRTLRAHSITTSATILFLTALTILSETSELVEDFLKSFGHHWIIKGVIGLLFYGILFLILSNFIKDAKNQKDLNKSIKWVAWSTLIGLIVIFGFFVLHFNHFI